MYPWLDPNVISADPERPVGCNTVTVRRTVAALWVIAFAGAACADDVDPRTATTTSVAATTTAGSIDGSASATTTTTTTTTTTSEPPAPPAEEPVAVTIRHVTVWDGEVITDNGITFIGTLPEREPGSNVFPFEGVAGPSSELARMAMPRITAGDSWPPGPSGALARTFVDDVLPAFVDDEELTDPLPFGGVDRLFIDNILITGTSIAVPWEVVEYDDESVVVRTDHDFEHRDIQRGAEATLVGAVTGEFRVDRHRPLDAEGRLDVRFDLTDSAGASRPVHQYWEATPALQFRTDDWTAPTDAIDRHTEILVPPPGDPEVFDVAVGYGGRSWAGRVTIDQTWSQLDRDPTPTTVHAELALTSNLTADGQWLRISLDDWTADGPPFGDVDAPTPGPDFALVVAPDGHIGGSHPRETAAADTQNQRLWFEQIFLDALPALPAERIAVGASWQTRLQGEQEGSGPVYTVTALDPRLLELEVSGDFGSYIGDRYDGYTVGAEIDGTLRIDRQAAIPLAVDIEMTGTITFAEAGEPDPSTSRDWSSSLRLRADAAEPPDAGHNGE